MSCSLSLLRALTEAVDFDHTTSSWPFLSGFYYFAHCHRRALEKSTQKLPLARKTETSASVHGQLAVGVQQQRRLHRISSHLDLHTALQAINLPDRMATCSGRALAGLQRPLWKVQEEMTWSGNTPGSVIALPPLITAKQLHFLASTAQLILAISSFLLFFHKHLPSTSPMPATVSVYTNCQESRTQPRGAHTVVGDRDIKSNSCRTVEGLMSF